MRESHLLFAQQAQQGGRQIAAGIDLTDSQQRGHIREAPGVDVEHGGDRHIDVITMHPSLGKRATDMRCKTQRVQHQLAMAEANSLGLPGRPGGIEHSRLGVFVEIREVEIRGGRCKQRLVFGSKRHRRIKQRRSLIVDQDVMTDSFQAWRDLRDQREKLAVEQQHVGLGMNQGKGDLFGAQAHIHRLQDCPHHRDGEKAFQIAMAIPIHHRHGLPGFHAEAGQAAGQATDPLAQRAISKAQLALISDFLLWRERQWRMQQVLDEQRVGIGRRCWLNDFDGHGGLGKKVGKAAPLASRDGGVPTNAGA